MGLCTVHVRCAFSHDAMAGPLCSGEGTIDRRVHYTMHMRCTMMHETGDETDSELHAVHQLQALGERIETLREELEAAELQDESSPNLYRKPSSCPPSLLDLTPIANP